MAKNIDNLWATVETALSTAKGVYFDGCHKIYIAMDDTENAWFLTSDYTAGAIEIKTLREWYDNSCSLKFVSSVRTHLTDPNLGFDQLIWQGADEEDVPESWDRDEEN